MKIIIGVVLSRRKLMIVGHFQVYISSFNYIISLLVLMIKKKKTFYLIHKYINIYIKKNNLFLK